MPGPFPRARRKSGGSPDGPGDAGDEWRGDVPRIAGAATGRTRDPDERLLGGRGGDAFCGQGSGVGVAEAVPPVGADPDVAARAGARRRLNPSSRGGRTVDPGSPALVGLAATGVLSSARTAGTATAKSRRLGSSSRITILFTQERKPQKKSRNLRRSGLPILSRRPPRGPRLRILR